MQILVVHVVNRTRTQKKYTWHLLFDLRNQLLKYAAKELRPKNKIHRRGESIKKVVGNGPSNCSIHFDEI